MAGGTGRHPDRRRALRPRPAPYQEAPYQEAPYQQAPRQQDGGPSWFRIWTVAIGTVLAVAHFLAHGNNQMGG